jgi:metallo-beta-lactamase family protein
VTITASVQASQRLTRSRWPKVIISASGMATGGRVLHHLKTLAPEPEEPHRLSRLPGRRHARRGHDRRRHRGQDPRRVRRREGRGQPPRGVSGHADADGLMAWLRNLHAPPAQTFVVHGEPAAADALRMRIADELKWKVRVPQLGEEAEV